MRNNLLLMTVALVAGAAWANPVEWEFPRTRNCHEGMPFSDGVTGVLVWGGGDTINLTVGRADLWDHRGGYPWLASQSYTNIVAAVESGDTKRLMGLFKKETPKGEPRNPYMLPLGRVVVKLQGGATLVRGELDPFTGLGKLFLSDGKVIELAMGKFFYGLFAVKFPNGAKFDIELKNCMEFSGARDALASVGFKPARYEDWTSFRVERGGSFFWQIPEDNPVGLNWWASKGELFVRTNRGDKFPSWRGPAPVFSNVSKKSVDHWTAFWARSAKVKVPDPVLQRAFDYGMYRFGAMTDPDGVPAGLQGPWLEDDKLVPWNGDYHFNINVQECYAPAFRGGHFAHLMPLFKMVLGWRPRLRENAKMFVGIDDGYSLPHSVDDRGTCIGGFWTGTIDHGSTAWVAAMMYRYVKYSGDVEFLRNGGYDFMKGAMNVYCALFEEKDGRLSLPIGPSPEWGGAHPKGSVGRDPSFQLACAHRLARDLVDAAKRLGEKPDPRWADVGRRLPLYNAGPNGFRLFGEQDLTESHRHHSHMAALYPFDLLDLGDKQTREQVDKTYWNWTAKGTGLWTGWCVPWASILHTHAGNAVAAVELLRAWDAYFCDPGHGSHHNAVNCGFTSFAWGNDIMQMDGQCAAATAVMELLVHEVNGKVEYFRGCPESWKGVSFESIRLSDGTSVSGSRINGVVKISVNK